MSTTKRKICFEPDLAETTCVDGLLLLKNDNVIKRGEINSKMLDLNSFQETFKKLKIPFESGVTKDYCSRSIMGKLPEVLCNSVGEQQMEIQRCQSQRLLLLRHSSKCIHPNGQCPVSPFCLTMKNVWLHIKECKDQNCNARHCISSRYILSHYSNCRHADCPVCVGVRVAVKKNYERKMANRKNTVLGLCIV
jgi:hypothetical protein